MSRRTIGYIITGIGVVVVAVAALADQIGIGASDDFGWKQIVGIVVGALIVVAGLIVAALGEQPAPAEDSEA